MLPKRTVDTFFDKWSPKMAYILGYFAADGTMYITQRGGHYIAFEATDEDLIVSIKRALQATNTIENHLYSEESIRKRCKPRFRLQIGSKKMFTQLYNLGFTPRKSHTLQFPNVPKCYLCHFIRGYFDGDGCAYFRRLPRKNRNNKLYTYFSISFVCSNKHFLECLRDKLLKHTKAHNTALYLHDRAYTLSYNSKNVLKLYSFMYPTPKVLCLKRKQAILETGFKALGP